MVFKMIDNELPFSKTDLSNIGRVNCEFALFSRHDVLDYKYSLLFNVCSTFYAMNFNLLNF